MNESEELRFELEEMELNEIIAEQISDIFYNPKEVEHNE